MSIYLNEFKRVSHQAFSCWNRDPASPSYGCFDRPFWGWKYKDFPDATMQYGVRLAVEYAVLREQQNLGPLLEAYVDNCAAIQLADGSFNQCYPYERSPGVVYDILSTFVYLRRGPWLSRDSANQLDEIMQRAVRFALKTDEKHGQVANHIAQFAYELLEYGLFASHEPSIRQGKRYLGRLVRLFEPNEGWFLEYDGADGGYQTRCLRYLVKCARLLDDDGLWRLAARSARFLEQVLMPDGSLHPMLGCRSTALLYPSGLEALAARDKSFIGLASRARQAWEKGLVPLPSWLDFGNAIRLADDALEAHAIASNQTGEAIPSVPKGDTHFPAAGLWIRRMENSVVYVSSSLGGVVVVYQKDSAGDWKLTYEDSGYLCRLGQSSFLTRMAGGGRLTGKTTEGVSVEVPFFRALHEDLTPWKFLVLRILNQTLLRWQWLGDLFRKVVVLRLIGGRRKSPICLSRSIIVREEAVEIDDAFTGPLPSTLLRCRRVTGAHMASSRYFQEDELRPLQLPWSARAVLEAGNHRIYTRVALL